MSNMTAFDDHSYDDLTQEPLDPASASVEIRRNGGVSAAIGGVASAVAIAYLARATGSGASSPTSGPRRRNQARPGPGSA